MTWTLRITASGRDTPRVSVRRQQFTVGRPMAFDSESPHISAVEYAAGAVGAEIIGGLQEFAKRRRLEIDHLEATVSVQVEGALGYFEVVGEEGVPRIASARVKVYVSSPAGEPELRKLWDDTLARLPLVGTLRGVVDLTLELILTP